MNTSADGRTCPGCKTWKPYSDFYKNRSTHDGCQAYCKPCWKARVAISKAKHRDKRLAQARDYANRYNAEHADEIKEKRKAWYQRKGRDYYQQWRDDNREKSRDYVRRYQKTHVEVLAAAVNRYRLRLSLSDPHHTAEEFTELCRRYDNRCLCCHEEKPLTRDHVVPVVDGGSDDISNIQPLCKSCNSRKGRKATDYRPG